MPATIINNQNQICGTFSPRYGICLITFEIAVDKQDMELKDNLKKHLKKRGWTQAQLAKAADVPKQTINNLLATSMSTVSPKNIKAIASALKISVHELLYGGPDPYEPVGQELLTDLFSGDIRVQIQRITRKPPDKK